MINKIEIHIFGFTVITIVIKKTIITASPEPIEARVEYGHSGWSGFYD